MLEISRAQGFPTTLTRLMLASVLLQVRFLVETSLYGRIATMLLVDVEVGELIQTLRPAAFLVFLFADMISI